MSNPFFLVAGDLLPILTGQLVDENGYPVPEMATASACALRVQPSGIPTTLWEASVAFSLATAGASAGHVTHAWASGFSLATPGFYQGQFQLTDSASRTLTIPNPGYLPIVVGTSM